MFPERKKYVERVIAWLDKAWHQPRYVDGYVLGIDSRSIHLEKTFKDQTPVLLLTGWGSGWEGIAPLAFSLTCEGYWIILLSLPGYGESENPPRDFYEKEDLYLKYARIALGVINMRGFSKAYFIGHSMGAEILARAAAISSGTCQKLVLLNPSGIRPVSGFWAKATLIWRFAVSSVRLRKEYYKSEESYNDYLKPLIDICGRQKSPWGWGRLRQRREEFKEICKGQLPEILKRVTCPVVFISGDRDTVYPAYESNRIIQGVVETPNYECVIVKGLHHNPTLFHSEVTARIIAEHLP